MNEELEQRVSAIEHKLDEIMEMVYLGRHLMAFAKFLAWLGGVYITVETYIKTVIHR